LNRAIRPDIGSANRPDQVPPDGTAASEFGGPASEFGGPAGWTGEGGGLSADMGFDRKRRFGGELDPCRVFRQALCREKEAAGAKQALRPAACGVAPPLVADARHSACMPTSLCREL
jgi:hypothetical protein